MMKICWVPVYQHKRRINWKQDLRAIKFSTVWVIRPLPRRRIENADSVELLQIGLEINACIGKGHGKTEKHAGIAQAPLQVGKNKPSIDGESERPVGHVKLRDNACFGGRSHHPVGGGGGLERLPELLISRPVVTFNQSSRFS